MICATHPSSNSAQAPHRNGESTFLETITKNRIGFEHIGRCRVGSSIIIDDEHQPGRRHRTRSPPTRVCARCRTGSARESPSGCGSMPRPGEDAHFTHRKMLRNDGECAVIPGRAHVALLPLPRRRRNRFSVSAVGRFAPQRPDQSAPGSSSNPSPKTRSRMKM